MNIQEVLTEYQFRNVGQFRAIAQSLGYSEQYNKGCLYLTRGDDEYRTTVAAIRDFTKNALDPAIKDSSMEVICKYFDREQALSSEYKETLSKEGIDIINWGDLNHDAKDRFTVIDHNNKICYTGKEMYEYALQNGYLLDGKGTKLEKGMYSELTEVGGKLAKFRLTEDGVSIHYRKEALIIPNALFGKKLSKKQQQDLLDGKVIVLPNKKGGIMLQVDRDLNAVVIRSEKELSIPAKIGEYELTPADKYLLANGYSLDNKILHGDNGFFIANVSMNADKKGFAFSNIQMLSETKAKEILQAREAKDKQYQEIIPESRELAKELKEAIAKNDYEKMSQLKDEGYKPSEEVIKGLGHDLKIDEKQAVVIEKLFGIKPEVSQEKETVAQDIKEKVVSQAEKLPENYIIKLDKPILIGGLINTLEQSGIDVSVLNDSFSSETAKDQKADALFIMVENGKVTDWEPQIHEKEYPIPIKLFSDFEIAGSKEMITSEKDIAFKNALGANDFEKLSELKEQGYQPSKELLQSLDTIPDNTMVAAQKIFGLKAGIAPALNDVKLAQSQPDKDLTRPLTNTINRAFSDL